MLPLYRTMKYKSSIWGEHINEYLTVLFNQIKQVAKRIANIRLTKWNCNWFYLLLFFTDGWA